MSSRFSNDDKRRERNGNGPSKADYKRALISATINALIMFFIVLPLSVPNLSDIYLAARASALVFLYKLAVELNITIVSLNDVRRALGQGGIDYGTERERSRRRRGGGEEE